MVAWFQRIVSATHRLQLASLVPIHDEQRYSLFHTTTTPSSPHQIPGLFQVFHVGDHHHSSRKRVKQGKKRKKSRFFGFKKNVKKTVITCIVGLKVLGLNTTLNQTCCSLRNWATRTNFGIKCEFPQNSKRRRPSE